jgi:hypothetical protein
MELRIFVGFVFVEIKVSKKEEIGWNGLFLVERTLN